MTCWTAYLEHSASVSNCLVEGPEMNLTGKRALITGGAKGIGAAIAIDLAQQGCDIAINGRHDDASAAEVREQIESTGRKCVSILADMTKPEEINHLVDEATSNLGGLDILVHSAGGPASNKPFALAGTVYKNATDDTGAKDITVQFVDARGQGFAEALAHPGLDHPGAMDRRERLGGRHAARQQQPVRHQGHRLCQRKIDRALSPPRESFALRDHGDHRTDRRERRLSDRPPWH